MSCIYLDGTFPQDAAPSNRNGSRVKSPPFPSISSWRKSSKTIESNTNFHPYPPLFWPTHSNLLLSFVTTVQTTRKQKGPQGDRLTEHNSERRTGGGKLLVSLPKIQPHRAPVLATNHTAQKTSMDTRPTSAPSPQGEQRTPQLQTQDSDQTSKQAQPAAQTALTTQRPPPTRRQGHPEEIGWEIRPLTSLESFRSLEQQAATVSFSTGSPPACSTF
ncbi:hypothetical protein CRENBAI_011187 [Crenichthys baileyi]|uniref:Uncharacterized protein n=1 Tax=Crenichthys baileyi TaxID=28760 RepID=A0AAV9S5V5_9TELE